jgi:prepilin-type N-terminal cleavage/methylation domain-containing protein
LKKTLANTPPVCLGRAALRRGFTLTELLITIAIILTVAALAVPAVVQSLYSAKVSRATGDIPIVLYHHERYDGSGYPKGLAGEEIPLNARIFAVADVYDALISDRPYRAGLSKEQVLLYLREKAGTQFDPSVVQAMIEVLSEEERRLEAERKPAHLATPETSPFSQ